MATNDQKNQLIARIATNLCPSKLQKARFQLWLEDPDNMDMFTGFINQSYPPIPTNTLPEPILPEWSQGSVLSGDVGPEYIDFANLRNSTHVHSDLVFQDSTNSTKYPKGEKVFSALVQNYTIGKDEDGSVYQVAGRGYSDLYRIDEINSHYGLKELVYLQSVWGQLPLPIRTWAFAGGRKHLYAWRGAVRKARATSESSSTIEIPFLNCSFLGSVPDIEWREVCSVIFHPFEFALCG